MTPCPALPVTGSSSWATVIIAAALLAVGGGLVALGRPPRHTGIGIIILVASVTIVNARRADAATCPSPSTTAAPAVVTTTSTDPATTVAPATSTTTTTSTVAAPSSTTSTTSTTTSTTSTTQAGIAPIGRVDNFVVDVDEVLTGNVLDNDDLGQPPAQITDWFTIDVIPGASFTFDPGTGAFTFSSSHVPPSGTPEFYVVVYELTNVVRSTSASLNIRVIDFPG